MTMDAPARTREHDDRTAFDPEAAYGWTTEQIDRALAELEPVSPEELEGKGLMPGRIVCAFGVSALPAPIRGPVLKLVSGVSRLVWHGKYFESDGTGGNQWAGGLRWMRFRITPGADGIPTTALDYDRDVNPRFLRAGIDEVRRIRPDLYFAQMRLRTKSGAVPLVGVTLEPGR